MKYAEMSDFEINKAVGEIILKGRWECKPNCSGNYSDSWYYGSVDTFVTPYPQLPDYCYSWADAGPIIEGAEIGLVRVADGWCATNDAATYEGIYFVNSNPLRAAMIVFLMMQEEK